MKLKGLSHRCAHPLRGFTLVELLVTIAVIAILMGILLPVIGLARTKARVAKANMLISNMSNALEKYREDFRTYPPDNVLANGTASSNGSELLYSYLGQRLQWGEMHYGPYIEMPANEITPSAGGQKQMLSPLGGTYLYGRYNPDNDGNLQSCLIIDPGLDRKLGGSLDPKTGFVPDATSDSQDNLTSNK
jgi:prepilin-type N-terminal cleavage/methylation domain-containing protein